MGATATRGPRLASLLCFILGLLAAGPALAREPRKVLVGVIREWPPEYSIDEDGEPTGFAVEVVEAVARQATLTLDYRVFDSYTTAVAALDRGEIDLIPSVGISDERRQMMVFTEPIDTFVISVFVRRESTTLNRIEDLAGRRVGVVEANLAGDILAGHSELTLQPYPDVRPALYDLLAGGVDAIVYPRPVVEAMAERARLSDRIRVLEAPVVEVKRAIAVKKNDAELFERVDAGVRQLVPTEEYAAIYGRWFAAPERFWTVGRISWTSGAVVFVLLAGFGLWRGRAKLALDRSEKERRRAERDLGRTATKHRAVMEHAHDAVFVIDARGKVIEVNSRASELFGYDAEELLGREISSLVPSGEREVQANQFSKLLEGEALLFERTAIRKDGTTVEVEISSRRINSEIIVSIVRDISERKRNEVAWREHERMLHQAQKMEAVGRLAGSVAHDFNNILTVIMGGAELVAREVSEAGREDVEEIRKAAARGATLCRQLLATSRQQKLEPKVLSPREVIESIEPMLRRLLPQNVILALDLEAEAAVLVDAGRLEQVVTNLVLNARDALADGGTITIRAREVCIEEPRMLASSLIPEGRYVQIGVEDDGIGMDAATASRVFEPFFTTKSDAAGTGLGMSTVLGILQQSGGFIDVTTAPGQGARFDVYLRVSNGSEA